MKSPFGNPTIDRNAVGIDFIDLLFALAVAEVFAPIAKWASDPASDLGRDQWWALAVAISLILLSWIGYHISANRARFLPKFVNVELVRLALDVMMRDVNNDHSFVPQHQLLAISGAFFLYLCWDLASAYQKKRKPYEDAWTSAYEDLSIPEVKEPWSATKWSRVVVTAVFLGLFVLFSARASEWDDMSSLDAQRVSGATIALLVSYRLAKPLAEAAVSSDSDA